MTGQRVEWLEAQTTGMELEMSNAASSGKLHIRSVPPLLYLPYGNKNNICLLSFCKDDWANS